MPKVGRQDEDADEMDYCFLFFFFFLFDCTEGWYPYEHLNNYRISGLNVLVYYHPN